MSAFGIITLINVVAAMIHGRSDVVDIGIILAIFFFIIIFICNLIAARSISSNISTTIKE